MSICLSVCPSKAKILLPVMSVFPLLNINHALCPSLDAWVHAPMTDVMTTVTVCGGAAPPSTTPIAVYVNLRA